MHIIPLIIAVLAAVVFLLAWADGRRAEPVAPSVGPKVPLGLCLLTVALILHFVIVSKDVITIG